MTTDAVDLRSPWSGAADGAELTRWAPALRGQWATVRPVPSPPPTGFVLYVEMDPEDFADMSVEVQRAAATLRELVHEWLPKAQTRTAVSTTRTSLSTQDHRRAAASRARPPAGSLRATLAGIPETPEVVIDLRQRLVTVDQEVLRLPPREFDLLAHLAEARGRVVTRDELRRTVWSDRDPGAASRTVDVHVRRLRAVPVLASLIMTVHGLGYRVPPGPHLRLTG